MIRSTKIQRFLFIIGVTVGVYLMIRYILPLVAPFIISYGIFCLLRPFLKWFRKHTQLPDRITGVILILILACFVLIFLYIIVGFLCKNIYDWIAHAENFGKELMIEAENFCIFIDQWIGCEEGRSMKVISVIIEKWQQIGHEKMYAFVTDSMQNSFKILGKIGVNLLIGFIGAVMLVRGKYALLNHLKENCFYKEICLIVRRISEVTATFIKTQSIIMGIMAVVCMIGLFILKLPYPVLVGVGIAILDAFPILGSGMILVPWAIFELVKRKVICTVGLLILYGITVCIREILEPKLMGNKLNIHPFYILMATVVGVELFGFFGIFMGPLGLVMIIEILKQVNSI